MKRLLRTFILVILVMSMIIITACTNNDNQASGTPTSFIDDLGRNVNLPETINRIAVDTASIGEILIGLGYSDKIVAINDTISNSTSGPLASISEKEVFTSGNDPYAGINFEQMLNLQVDVYFTMANLNNKDALEAVADKLPNTVVIALNVNDLNGYIATIQTLGKLFEINDADNKYFSFFKECIEILASHEPNIEDFVNVYYEISPYSTFSDNTPGIGSQIPAAFGVNIAGDNSANWFEVSPEFVIQKNPDVIVVPTWNFGEYASGFNVTDTTVVQHGLEEIASRSELSTINAIKKGRLLALDSEIISTPRSIIGILYMAKYFYPNEFSDVDVDNLHLKYLNDFFSIHAINGLFEYEYES